MATVLDLPLGFFNDHFGDLHMPVWRLIEGGTDHFALDHPFHVGHFLWPLIDEQHDKLDVVVVRRNAVGDLLQNHRLACARRRHNQAALTTAHRRHQIDNPRRQLVLRALQHQPLRREKWYQGLKRHHRLLALRRIAIDGLHFQHRKKTLFFPRLTDQADYRVTRSQGKTPDLRGTHVDVFGTRQITAVRAAQKAIAVAHHFNDATALHDAVLLSVVHPQDLKQQVMTAQRANALEIQLQSLLRQLTHVHRLQNMQIQQLIGAALDLLQQSLLVNVLINKRIAAKIALAAILVVVIAAILVVAILVVAIGVLVELLTLKIVALLFVVPEITIAAIPALLTLLTLGLLRLTLLTLILLRLALLALGLLLLALLTLLALGLLLLALLAMGLLRLALLALGLLRLALLALGLLLLGRGLSGHCRLLGRGLSGHCRLLGRGRLGRGRVGVVAILPGVSRRCRLCPSRLLGGSIVAGISIPQRCLFACFDADAQWFFFRLYSWDSQGPASAARSRGGGLVGIFSLGIRGAIFVLTCHIGLNSSNGR